MAGMKTKPQISMRLLLMFVAILAVAMGWYADRQRLRTQLRQAAQRDFQQKEQIYAMKQAIVQLEVNASQPGRSVLETLLLDEQTAQK